MKEIKKTLAIGILMFILAGCSAKQIPSENQGASGAREQTGTTKSEEKPLNILQLSEPSPQKKVILDVPLISQNPELKYGCEVTSLAMVLQYAGIKVSKTELASKIKKDNDPLVVGKSGDIKHWGNPNDGFVGDMTGKKKGYAVYVQPLQELMEHYLPGRTVNLTGKPFDDVLSQIKKGKPVVVWTTGDYKAPNRVESWQHGDEQIKATLDLHAVVLVGFEPQFIYLNDPLAVKKDNKVNRQTFIQSWNALGKQALSYR